MAINAYLDINGLTRLWGKIKAFVQAHVPTLSKKTGAIPFAVVDGSSTSTDIKATVDGITELTDGVCVYLRNSVVTSATGWTLNVNNLGAKPVYLASAASSRTTTTFNVNYAMLFIYNSTRVSGGCWDVYYYSFSNTIGYQLRTNSTSLPMDSVVYRYRLLFTKADGTKYVPANNDTKTNATGTRAVCQTPIDPFGRICFYGSTSSVAAGSRPSISTLWDQYNITLGYSFNRTGAALVLTLWKPVYIKCAPQSDGSAIIDADTPYVQDLPTTADGKIYIYLGIATAETTVEIVPVHPIYEYRNGAVRQWTNATRVTSINGQTGDVTVNEIPSATGEADGTALVAVDGEWTKQTGYGYKKTELVSVWQGYTYDQGAYSPTAVQTDEAPYYYELIANEEYGMEVGGNRYTGLTAIADVVTMQGVSLPLVYIGNGQLIGLSGGDTSCPFAFAYVNVPEADITNVNISIVNETKEGFTAYSLLKEEPVPHTINNDYIKLTSAQVTEALGYAPLTSDEIDTKIFDNNEVHGWYQATIVPDGQSQGVWRLYDTPYQIINKYQQKVFIISNASGHEGIYYFSGYKQSGHTYTLRFVCQKQDGSRECFKVSANLNTSNVAGTWETLTDATGKSCMTVSPSTAITLAPTTSSPTAVALDASTSKGTAFTADGTGIVCNKEMDVLISGNCTWRSGGATVVTEVSIKQAGSGMQVKTGFAGGVSGVQNQHTITISPFILHVQQNDTIQMRIKIFSGTANGDYTLSIGDNWLTVQEL